MIVLRGVLAAAMVVAGIAIVVRMLPFGLVQALPGMVLGLAMAALGTIRLRQIYRYVRTR